MNSDMGPILLLVAPLNQPLLPEIWLQIFPLLSSEALRGVMMGRDGSATMSFTSHQCYHQQLTFAEPHNRLRFCELTNRINGIPHGISTAYHGPYEFLHVFVQALHHLRPFNVKDYRRQFDPEPSSISC
jgi:hypothetical protein